MSLLIRYWHFAAIAVLVGLLAVAGNMISNRNTEIKNLEQTVRDRDFSIQSLNETIAVRDQQLRDVGKTGSQDYATLSKQCSANSKEWFDRGVAVGRVVCVPNPASAGGQPSPGATDPAAKR